MSSFHAVTSVKEMPVGTSKLVEVQGKIIAIFHTSSGWFAIDDRCTHRGGPLSEGKIEGGLVICPWHQARFDLVSGQCQSNPTFKPVTTYRVLVSDDTVQLEIG